MRNYLWLALAALIAVAGCVPIDGGQPDLVRGLNVVAAGVPSPTPDLEPTVPPTIEPATPSSIAAVATATQPIAVLPLATETEALAVAVVPSRTPLPIPTSAPPAPPSPTPTRTRTPTVPAATASPLPKPAATPYPVPSGSISRIDARFKSPSLDMDREVIIYLPPGYDAQAPRRYPVLYLLHGWGGFNLQHTTEWEQAGLMETIQELTVKGSIQPMIVVQPFSYLPNNDCSLYFNHGPGTDGKPWGDYIWKDVVNYIDASFRTITRRESRAVGGFSFGGQGALSLGLTHPEVFKVVGAHSPSFRAADGSIASMNDPNWYNQFDPIWLVENTTRARQLTIWIDVATGDDKVRNCGPESDRCVEEFHQLLVSKGIVHHWQDQWPGPHDMNYWQAHFSDYLAWYSSQLAGE